ncbi:MAG: PilC/PilY family type IV pilus protein [Desulfobacterium sp.]|nr:PilC/PilY family type IV pilus protein [Desulfobacterium sp.]
MKTIVLKLLKGLTFTGLSFTLFLNCSFAEVSTHINANFTSLPVNLTGNDVTPLVMMNISRDHQLSYKAYNDYSDLDNDGIPETTYKDNIDYYGYFDTKKCYSYSTTDNRFVPVALATGPNNHYCAKGSGQWSGNFLNWATMTRMDVVRKILYGGMRSTDTDTLTVLERHYLPTEAHAFAKFYNGSDIDQLTPFTGINISPPSSTSVTSIKIPNHVKETQDRTFTTGLSASYGDQIKVFVTGNEANQWMIGGVDSINIDAGTITIRIPADSWAGAGSHTTWTLKNLSQTGITICNLTKGTTSGTNRYSDTNTNPPIIKVVRGNFALWTANERWQGYWFSQKSNLQSGFEGGFKSNGNRAYLSGINASAENPSQTTHGLGTGSAKGEYYARVEVANSAWFGQEKYKKYGSSYKPIGLLQVYGETDQIHFGLFTGTFDKNISGGVLRKNVGTFTDEVNTADGTFISGANGIVDNLNRLRLYGYDYNDGTYIGRDECNYQQIGLVLSGGSNSQGSPATQGNCSSWGNPMSEIYLESLRYLAGKSPNPAFGSGTKDTALGLTVASWSDPLDPSNYCAPLNVLNFNASVSSYDGDQMGGVSDLGSSSTASELTDIVGTHEGIDASSWFIGSNGVMSNDLCNSKDIGSGFGSFSGLCPEAPTQKGTYLMAGVAHYANTNRIRSDLIIPPSRANSRDLMVTTYGIALATNVPKIEITIGDKKVTVLPAYRLDRSSAGTGPFGGGTLVDFKIIEQTSTYGKFYVNWEDSEMGGDYDQDMWGTIEYFVNGDNITITTHAIACSSSKGQGFGYIISGTDKDGAHFHSGIYNFDYTDTTGVIGCTNCNVGDGPTSATYAVTGSSAGVLEDPLLYAAKWGGFVDSNNNKLPDLQSEWDEVTNYDGSNVPDGIPDNYFYATNPNQLENSLNRVFLTIVQRASSGTAAAVVSNNVNGVGALYQAYYEPVRQDAANRKVSWIGTVQSLWLDSAGYLREDDGDAVLGGYWADPVIQMHYDDSANKTRVRRYSSTRDDVFTPISMTGKVTAYNAETGAVTFTVKETNGAGGPFSSWDVYNLTNNMSVRSITSSSISPVGASNTFTVSPLISWVNIGDTIMVGHFEWTTIELEDVKTLWNARERLSFSIADADVQRSFANKADDSLNGGRFIKTWIDANGNNVVDAGEFIDFDRTSITPANFGFFNVATEAEAKDLTDYIRGKEIAGHRSRTLDYDGDGIPEVIRLGDIVNSTPTVVGAPQERFDLLYKDTSYTAFKNQYSKRRQVVYVGSNGGMLHAFNGGFYDSATHSFRVSGKKYDGGSVTEHPLGAEIWAYTPMNLLPHLKWLKDSNYTHVYYVDGKPKVFDAKIFDPTDPDHPFGWGTVLVVGMRFGGGAMTIDTAADGLGVGTDRELRSAYIIMDITNPEKPPKLLAEIQVPDGSFSTSYPAAFTVNDKSMINKWFLSFGSGPTNLAKGDSDQNAMFYAFDLDEISNPGSSSSSSAIGGGTPISVGTGGSMRVLSCDTGIANSFVGDSTSVDWDLNYKADSVYFGVMGNSEATHGRLMRFAINEEQDWNSWNSPATFINTSQPVLSGVTPGMDESGNKWIFFGTGRFFVSSDQNSTVTQSIYGVKEAGIEISKTDLIDVSAAQVKSYGDLAIAVGTSTTINDLEENIELNYKGWYLDLPPINGTKGTAPSTRVLNSSALSGGVLFTPAYQPGIDPCTGEGFSRLYGLYYKTGTARSSLSTFGNGIDPSGVEYAIPFIELGHGFATTPSLHTGSETGDKELSVFTQLSTGTIVQTKAKTGSVRSGLESWIEPR